MPETIRFAAAGAGEICARSEPVSALGSAEILGGSGTLAIATVISAAAAGPASAPAGAGGLGAGGGVDTPDADEDSGAGSAAVGMVYEARCQVVQQGTSGLLPVQSFKFDAIAGTLGSSLGTDVLNGGAGNDVASMGDVVTPELVGRSVTNLAGASSKPGAYALTAAGLRPLD